MPRIALLASLPLLLPACASSGYERASVTATDTGSYGDDVRQLGARVGLAAEALRALTDNPGDSPRSNRETFRTFVRELANLEGLAASSRKAFARMDAGAGEFFASWSADTAAIVDAELKASAEERRAALQAGYARVSTCHAEVEPELARFVQQLEDLRLYLENDLTAAGIASARGSIERACGEAARLSARLDALARESDAARASLAPLEALAPANVARPARAR